MLLQVVRGGLCFDLVDFCDELLVEFLEFADAILVGWEVARAKLVVALVQSVVMML